MKKLLFVLFIFGFVLYGGIAFAELQVIDGPITAQSVTVNGQITIKGGSPGAGKVLTSDATGLATWQTSASSGIGGSGTINYFPIFTGTSSIGNSAVYQSGSNIGIGTTSPTKKLTVVAPNDSAVLGLSGASGNHTNISIGRTSTDGSLAVAAAGGQYAANSAAGDMVLRAETSAQKLHLLAGSGDSMLTVTSSKVGIGTANPLGKLQLGGSNFENNLLMLGAFDTTYVKAGRLGAIYPYVFDNRLIADNSGWGFGWTHENINDGSQYTMMYLGPDGQYGSNYRLWLDGNIALGDINKSYADIGTGFPAMTPNIKLDPAGNSYISTGNVGIGTNSPLGKLHIRGGNAYVDSINFGGTPTIALAVGDTDTGLHSLGDGSLEIYSNNVDVVSIRGATGVGIGTTAPLAKLEVNGRVITGSGTVANGLVYCSSGMTHSGSNFVCNAPRVDYVNGNDADYGNYVTCYLPNVRLVCMALGGRYVTSSCSASTTPISGGITAVAPYEHVVWQDWANIVYTLSVTCSPLP